MRLTIIFLISFLAWMSSYAQIDNDLVLHLNFESHFRDIKNNHQIIGQNTSFTKDRKEVTGALQLNGSCEENISYLQIKNSSKLQFTEGFTISFWAQLDLSEDIDSLSGECNSVGRHVLFSKREDNSDPSEKGIYAIITNDSIMHFGSSLGTGSLAYETTISKPGDWHFYTYVLSEEKYQFYLDGELKQSENHVIGFDEINKGDVFIGAFGINSTISMEMNNWLPLKGTLDDFKIHKIAMDLNKIKKHFIGNEEPKTLPPAIDQMNLAGTGTYYKGSYNSPYPNITKEGNSVYLINSSHQRKYGSYDLNLIQIKDSSTLGFSYNENGQGWPNYPPDSRNASFIKAGKRFYFIRDYIGPKIQDSLLIFDEKLILLSNVEINAIDIVDNLNIDNQLFVIGNNTQNYGIISSYDSIGNMLKEINVQDKIISVISKNDRILLNCYKSIRIINLKTENKLSFEKSDAILFLSKENLIFLDDGFVKSYNFDSKAFSQLDSAVLNCFIAENGSDYFLVKSEKVKKISKNNTVVNSFITPINLLKDENKAYRTVARFQNDIFFFHIQNAQNDSWKSYIMNSDGLIFHEKDSVRLTFGNYYLDASAAKFNNGDVLITYTNTNSNEILKFNSSYELLWRKTTIEGGSSILTNSDNSFWLLSYQSPHLRLLHLTNDENRCNYQVINPVDSAFCKPVGLGRHQISPQFMGNLKPVYNVYGGGNYRLKFPYNGLGLQFIWEKNGSIDSSIYEVGQSPMYYFIEADSSYRLKIRQEGCEQISKSAVHHYSEINTVPRLTFFKTESDILCKGDEILIEAGCNDGGSWLNWINPNIPWRNYGSRRQIIKPDSSTVYLANCYMSQSFITRGTYGNLSPYYVHNAICASPVDSLKITVIEPVKKYRFSGIDKPIRSFGSRKISSSEYVSDTKKRSYLASQSIELLPGFSTQPGEAIKLGIEDFCNSEEINHLNIAPQTPSTISPRKPLQNLPLQIHSYQRPSLQYPDEPSLDAH